MDLICEHRQISSPHGPKLKTKIECYPSTWQAILGTFQVIEFSGKKKRRSRYLIMHQFLYGRGGWEKHLLWINLEGFKKWCKSWFWSFCLFSSFHSTFSWHVSYWQKTCALTCSFDQGLFSYYSTLGFGWMRMQGEQRRQGLSPLKLTLSVLGLQC